MTNSNQNSQVQKIAHKIAAYDDQIRKTTQTRDESLELLTLSRESSRRQKEKNLTEQEAKLHLLTTYPVALHAGEDRNRRLGAQVRPLTPMEQQLYSHHDETKRLLMSCLICFAIGVFCLLIRQSGITIIAMIGMGLSFFLLKGKKHAFGQKKQQYVREQIIHQWTNECSLLERSIQQKRQGQFSYDTFEDRASMNDVQMWNGKLERLYLERALAVAELNALQGLSS